MDQSAPTSYEQGRVSRRNAARSAILEAARRLAARSDPANLSLTAVAAEAGFGPSTVFGHFRNKDELLLAIVAEDLAGLAAMMRGAFPKQDPAQNYAPGYATGATVPEETPTEPDDLQAAPPFGERPRLVSVNSPADVTPQAEMTDTNSGPGEEPWKSDRPRVDAWLERRLRMFEHTVADIERRLVDTERGMMRAIGLSEEGAKILCDRLESLERRHDEALRQLSDRVDEGERRQRGIAAEFRAATNDAALRLEMLEAARRAEQDRMLAESQLPPAVVPDEAEIKVDQELDEASVPPPQPATENASEQSDYLSAARRAASAAAMLADMEEKPQTEPAWKALARSRVRLGRRHYVMIAVAGLAAFGAGALAAFYIGVAQGREQATFPPVAASAAHAARMAGFAAPKRPLLGSQATPLDRLSSLANAGDAKAQLMIGLKYLHGDGIAVDQPRAAQWIRRAAQQHEAFAQYWMGVLYERGDGVAPDAAEAVRWYEAAASQGNRKAMHALGIACAEGRGTQKSYSEAARWFSKAAAFGFVNSQFNLAVLYERGQGVPQSLLNAYKWYLIAAKHGDSESRSRIEALKTQLTADDIDAAERAAAAFQPQAAPPDVNGPPVAHLADRSPVR